MIEFEQTTFTYIQRLRLFAEKQLHCHGMQNLKGFD